MPRRWSFGDVGGERVTASFYYRNHEGRRRRIEATADTRTGARRKALAILEERMSLGAGTGYGATTTFAKVATDRMAVWQQGETTVIATAWTLDDQTPVTLFVSQLADDLFNGSDSGLAAGALADEGVDLDSKVAGASFQLVQQSMRLSPSMGDTGQWDLSLSATKEELGDASIELSEAVIRAEGLKALARRRPVRSFGDRIVRAAGQVGLRIEPQAKLPLRYRGASRRVTYHLVGDHHDAFVQSISRASASSGYDHARALFSDAGVEEERRMAAVEERVRLEGWQYEALSEVCLVVTEPNLEGVLANLAA